MTAYDIALDAEFMKRFDILSLELPQLLASSDFISLNVPLTSETRHMINAKSLQQMKSTAFLINTSRGEVINESALLAALESDKIAGAALDVFPEEPPFQNPILKKIIQHPKVISTPHVATNTLENKTATARRVCENLLAVISGELEKIDRVV